MKHLTAYLRSQLLPGLCLGLALLVSALLAVHSLHDSAVTLRAMALLPLLVLLYAAIGIVLMAIHHRPRRPRPTTPYLSGLAAWYLWLVPVLAWILFFRLTGFAAVERCLLLNLLLLFALWLIEYAAARRMAKQLNGALGARSAMPLSLIVDLDDCPQGAEAFCIEIERYCIRNHISYTFIERDKPAIVVMDGVKHRVELGVYYGYVPGWFLKFTEL